MEKKTGKAVNDGESPYWKFIEKYQIKEPVEANPDSIAEAKGAYYSYPYIVEKADELKEKFKELSNRERFIVILLSEGLSQYDVAKRLKISRDSVSEYLNRARRKLKKYENL